MCPAQKKEERLERILVYVHPGAADECRPRICAHRDEQDHRDHRTLVASLVDGHGGRRWVNGLFDGFGVADTLLLMLRQNAPYGSATH